MRPVTIDDVPAWRRQDQRVAVITPEYVVKYPSLGQHLLAAIAEAERLGMTVEDGTIVVPKTDEELEAVLADEQRQWDDARNWHAAALVDPASIESWKRTSIDMWVASEGATAIDWWSAS